MAAVVLLFAGAALCAGLAAVMLLRDARSFVARVFATGMAVLAMEAIFNAASIYTDTYHNVVYWQRLRFLAAAFIPGVWLVFSLSFARRNYHEFLKTWRWGIGLAFLAPLGLVLFGFPAFFVDVPFSDEIARWSLGLGRGGQGFFLLFLLEAACILMNLERTLRASTGSLRWQIKFMILGVGSFFAARVYTGSQVLLFSRVTTTVEIVNAGALVIAGGGGVAFVLSLATIQREFLFISDGALPFTYCVGDGRLPPPRRVVSAICYLCRGRRNSAV
jgi:hypothetical protein